MYFFLNHCFISKRAASGKLGCGLEDTSESDFVDILPRDTFHCVAKKAVILKAIHIIHVNCTFLLIITKPHR